jgi:hypothetical protein
MIDMTVDEVRTIREKISLETARMNPDELRAYYADGAAKAEKRVAEIRKEKGILFQSATDNTAKN